MSHTRKAIKALALPAGIEGIDPAAVKRFIENTVNRRSVDPRDAAQAAVLLGGLLLGLRGGDDVGKELRGLMGERKARAKLFDPAKAAIDSDAWQIVAQLERGTLTYADAVTAFCEKVKRAEERQIKTWIAAIRPRVKEAIRKTDALAASAKKKG